MPIERSTKENIILFILAILCLGFFGFWDKINDVYNGNPQSGGREILCSLAVDDALDNPLVMAVFDEHCSEFNELLGEP